MRFNIISIIALLICSTPLSIASTKSSKSKWTAFEVNSIDKTSVDFSKITIGKKDDTNPKIIKRDSVTGTISSLDLVTNSSTVQELFSGEWQKNRGNLKLDSFINQSFRKTKSKSSNNQTSPSSYINYQPYSSTGLLKTAGSEYGSCFLLSNGYALTAAHCVYLDNGYFPNITASFGYQGKGSFEKTVKVTHTYVPYTWLTSNATSDPNTAPSNIQKNNDWAILKFEDNTLPATFGATTIASNEELTSRSQYMSLGYPMDRSYKLTYSLGESYISQSDYRYELYSYITGGMSGGPLISLHSEFDERMQEMVYYNYIIGINSTEEPDGDESSYYSYAGITRITNTMIDFIRSLS